MLRLRAKRWGSSWVQDPSCYFGLLQPPNSVFSYSKISLWQTSTDCPLASPREQAGRKPQGPFGGPSEFHQHPWEAEVSLPHAAGPLHFPLCSEQVKSQNISLITHPRVLLYTPVLLEWATGLWGLRRRLEILETLELKCRKETMRWRWIDSWGWQSQPKLTGGRGAGLCSLLPVEKGHCGWGKSRELPFCMTTNGICSSAFKNDDTGNQTVRNKDRWGAPGASEGFPVFSQQQQFIFHLHVDSEQGAEQKCFAISQ